MRAGAMRRVAAACVSTTAVVCCGVALAQSDATTTLHIIVVESHDRLTPTPHPGIVKRHEATIVLHQDKRIEQSFTNADVTKGFHQDPGGHGVASFGDNVGRDDSRFAWRVLGPNKLQRMWQKGQLLTVWTIETNAEHACSIEVKYLLKAGASVNPGKIAGTDIDATFNNYHVQSASCTIE
jgi:hypothetical protein